MIAAATLNIIDRFPNHPRACRRSYLVLTGIVSGEAAEGIGRLRPLIYLLLRRRPRRDLELLRVQRSTLQVRLR